MPTSPCDDVHITNYREAHMYGYVNNTTGVFLLFGSIEDANSHATRSGLTRYTVREVVAHTGAVTGIVNARTRAPRAATPPSEMAAFLAGGQ